MKILPALIPAVTETVVRDEKFRRDRAENRSDGRIRYRALLEKKKNNKVKLL